jgi:mRNA-decapping enzyme subunit 2
VEYDGNPHVFSEQGFQGMDPHHFRIVGGNFLNSDTNDLAPPPPTSRLQHLFHTKGQDTGGDGYGGDKDEGEFLTPFFSDDGATPWGEVVEEVKETVGSPERYTMLEQDRNSRSKANKNKKNKQEEPAQSILVTADNDLDLVFLTDKEITERSQKTKLAEWKASNETDRQYQQDLLDIQDWVNNLPRPAPTRQFGDFKFNVDALMEAFYQHY